ncbi:unnamed protein product [Discosporangium mesarthrocarpum]
MAMPPQVDLGLEDVDMYAGAGPHDLDDGGPSGGAWGCKVPSGPRGTLTSKKAQLPTLNPLKGPTSKPPGLQHPDSRGLELLGHGAWAPEMIVERYHKKQEANMVRLAQRTAKQVAFEYSMRAHTFHGGRPTASPCCGVTLVTQCSADRFPNVLAQALAWGGDISLAVLVPASPWSAARKTLKGVHDLCKAVDDAWATGKEFLHLDVAVLIGAEGDEERSEDSVTLYPINTLRNLALIQARDGTFHPSQSVFLVDSDFIPSGNLRTELNSADVQERLREGGSRRAAVVVPALEFAVGIREQVPEMPSKPKDVAALWARGQLQGFHTDYFPKGHGPTDFNHWVQTVDSSDGGALAYPVPYESCFEPYVVMAKSEVPPYDERFRGYGMNKVAHLLSVVQTQCSGGQRAGLSQETGREPDGNTNATHTTELIVLRKGFVFAHHHPRSMDWEMTYGQTRNPLRRYQLKGLWAKFQREVALGLPPVLSANTEALLRCVNLPSATSKTSPESHGAHVVSKSVSNPLAATKSSNLKDMKGARAELTGAVTVHAATAIATAVA